MKEKIDGLRVSFDAALASAMSQTSLKLSA